MSRIKPYSGKGRARRYAEAFKVRAVQLAHKHGVREALNRLGDCAPSEPALRN